MLVTHLICNVVFVIPLDSTEVKTQRRFMRQPPRTAVLIERQKEEAQTEGHWERVAIKLKKIQETCGVLEFK